MERHDTRPFHKGVEMQLCPDCKKGIKYIPVGYDKVVMCDSDIITIYTERGRRVEGYVPHKCEVENGGKEKDGNG